MSQIDCPTPPNHTEIGSFTSCVIDLVQYRIWTSRWVPIVSENVACISKESCVKLLLVECVLFRISQGPQSLHLAF